jgi:hypothetical protein
MRARRVAARIPAGADAPSGRGRLIRAIKFRMALWRRVIVDGEPDALPKLFGWLADTMARCDGRM